MTTRTVTLVLCTGTTVHGSLPPLPVQRPWWQEVDDVVASARAVHGVEVVVLRLLAVDTLGPDDGGQVCYLAEVAHRPEVVLAAWDGPDPVADDPRRASWARPGGPASDLAWAGAQLLAVGRTPLGAPVQVRTWNLSSLWRLGTASGTVWLKVVTDLLGPEAAVLELVGRTRPGSVPDLLAAAGSRLLLVDVPGEDLYGADPDLMTGPVRTLVGLQSELADGSALLGAGPLGSGLLGAGLPDRRADVVVPRIADVVQRWADRLEPATRGRLLALVSQLPGRFAAVAACGLPDTLVHGDLHPGNLRGTQTAVRLLDWADASLGRPELDGLGLVGAMAPEHRREMQQRWCGAWQEARPGSDPARSFELVAPVAAVLEAATYQRFLDGIEPDEHVYHRHDPLRWLRRADALLLAERG